MRYMFRHAPAVGRVPTLTDGQPPDPDIQEQVVINQVRSAVQWDEADRDMAVSNLVHETEAVRDSRWQALTFLLVALVLLIYGSWYTWNTIRHDRLVASQRAAAATVPYQPYAVPRIR